MNNEIKELKRALKSLEEMGASDEELLQLKQEIKELKLIIFKEKNAELKKK